MCLYNVIVSNRRCPAKRTDYPSDSDIINCVNYMTFATIPDPTRPVDEQRLGVNPMETSVFNSFCFLLKMGSTRTK